MERLANVPVDTAKEIKDLQTKLVRCCRSVTNYIINSHFVSQWLHIGLLTDNLFFFRLHWKKKSLGQEQQMSHFKLRWMSWRPNWRVPRRMRRPRELPTGNWRYALKVDRLLICNNICFYTLVNGMNMLSPKCIQSTGINIFKGVLYEAYIPVYCSVGHNCLFVIIYFDVFSCKKYTFNFHQTLYPKPECNIWIIMIRLIILCVCFHV